MASDPSGPPGPTRPKTPRVLSSPSSKPAHIFSPAPSLPRNSWFQLLASPAPVTASFLPPAAAVISDTAVSQPHDNLMHTTGFDTCCARDISTSNNAEVTNLATLGSTAHPHANDPWTRAHMRVCAHASEECPACSIAVVCCSCRALRFTPGPPPTSPVTVTLRSRSASPALFRNVGNAASPPHHDWNDTPDDDAYSRALAECDTCDNSSCPHGGDEPASWTITVECFDKGSEDFYDMTLRACTACNRSCKKTFMTHKIKSRKVDNPSRELTTVKEKAVLLKTAAVDPRPARVIDSVSRAPDSLKMAPDNSTRIAVKDSTRAAPAEPMPSPAESRPLTPLEVFSAVARTHRNTCGHLFTTCSMCSRGITCCQCNSLHTAPARLKLHCAACLHYACATCTTPFCCSCRKPWFPSDSPMLVLANRFRGGARSTKSSKKGSSSSSQSSGPGSLATAHSARNSPDPFAQAPIAALPTQSSADEIDAFGDATIRVSETIVARDESAHERSARAPSPSSNLPQGSARVFSRAPRPVITGATEDIPTAVPSRAPSQAASIVSTSSIGDAGIAVEPTRLPFPAPGDPPPFDEVIGRIHRRFPLASLKAGGLYTAPRVPCGVPGIPEESWSKDSTRTPWTPWTPQGLLVYC